MPFRYAIFALLLALLAGCNSVPKQADIETGRLMIAGKLIHTEYSSGPWWNYRFRVRNLESGQTYALRYIVKRNMTHMLSQPLEPGSYELYDWDASAKKYTIIHDYDISGHFEIMPGAITLYPGKVTTTVDSDTQSFNMTAIEDSELQPTLDEITANYPELNLWKVYLLDHRWPIMNVE
ncbi:hypothetical protein [Gynuella sp.]|uniref:hypothetical protein n=1 Tax=Gynuella sp. TaxID=2969146 RepID=UPI003D129F60